MYKLFTVVTLAIGLPVAGFITGVLISNEMCHDNHGHYIHKNSTCKQS